MPITANPAAPGDFMDVRYTDHDVVLARADVELGAVTAQEYEDMLTFSLGGLPGYRPLGFVAVSAVANGTPLVFVSTHLETQDHPAIQVGQIQELIDWMADQELPIVLVGDLNSAANASAPAGKQTLTYGMLLEAGFHDVWVRGHPFTEGLTCCHATDLLSENAFDQRLDLILLNDGAQKLVGGVQATIVGINPFQAGQPRWASDHAGLVATLRLPTASAAAHFQRTARWNARRGARRPAAVTCPSVSGPFDLVDGSVPGVVSVARSTAPLPGRPRWSGHQALQLPERRILVAESHVHDREQLGWHVSPPRRLLQRLELRPCRVRMPGFGLGIT
jgi:hypothetical protein